VAGDKEAEEDPGNEAEREFFLAFPHDMDPPVESET
jgi:hypothetical protein